MSADAVYLTAIGFLTLILLIGLGVGTWFFLKIQRTISATEKSGTRLVVEQIDPAKHRLNILLNTARSSTGPQACCKCKSWNHDAGQLVIMQNPTFAAVTRQLKPSNMCGHAVVEGEADPDAFTPPDHLDTWDLFGLCETRSECRHAMHKCPDFSARESVLP
jgi:hypothetical protein